MSVTYLYRENAKRKSTCSAKTRNEAQLTVDRERESARARAKEGWKIRKEPKMASGMAASVVHRQTGTNHITFLEILLCASP